MIISTFNYTWFLLLLLSAAYSVFITKKFKDKTEKEKITFMFRQAIVFSVCWILYKIGIGLDPEYTLFEFWNELPLQPCNTVIWLSVVAATTNNKSIMAYTFYAGILFALLALIMPSPGFYDINFFTARGLGYYLTHWFVIITGILYASLGLFKLDSKSALRASLTYLEIAAIMHLVNILMRATVYPEASYYYTFGNKDNAILTKVREIIPINLIYLVPFAAISYPVFLFENVVLKNLGRLLHKCKDRS